MNFRQFFKRIAFPLAAAFVIGNAIAQAPSEVLPVNPPQPVENDGRIEVLEFFAYGCIHCANLEPRLTEWVAKQPADVRVKRVPAAFAVRGIDTPPIFYTLEAMGLQEKLHQKLFDAANLENVMLGNPAVLNKWLEKQGVDPKKYEELQRSFSVQTKIARARKLSADYKIQNTPTLTVNGRYKLEGGSDRVFSNIDQLIIEARASSKPASAAASPAISTTQNAPAAKSAPAPASPASPVKKK